VDEADDENGETVYETEMQMLRNFRMRSGAPSSSPYQGTTPGTLRAILAIGQVAHNLPPSPPPTAGQQGNNAKPQRTKKNGCMDFFGRALQNLGGDRPAN
jgi:hypothetical protein